MSGEHILVVEDDPAILAGLSTQLEIEGYLVSVARDGEVARKWLEAASPDLILLDLMLPGLDGLSLLRWYRQRCRKTPVLILSAKGREEQKVQGLKAGADDYLAKPFGLSELSARIDVLLRRARGNEDRQQFADLSIDFVEARVYRQDKELQLSKKELGILLFLARRAGQTLPRETIFASVWGDLSICDLRAVDYHILNLRKKIETDPKHPLHILTLHGQGYQWAQQE